MKTIKPPTAAFYIVNHDETSDEIQYWNVDSGWTPDFNHATPFPPDVQTSPLPPGSTRLMLVADTGLPVSQLDILPPVGDMNVFLKSH
jgi:hypothetical protein